MQGADASGAVVVTALTYAYPGYQPIINDFTLDLPQGSRCLLIGANGAGKTTLLQILAGKHMVGQDAVRVLGRPAFHDIVSSSALQPSYFQLALLISPENNQPPEHATDQMMEQECSLEGSSGIVSCKQKGEASCRR